MTVETIPMDRAEAQRITERIRLKLDSAANVLDSLGALVADAYQRRADLAMGYDSWSAYADAEFAAQTANLAAPIRNELVGRLAAAGMGSRAIAPTLSVTDRHVRRIVADQVGHDVPPATGPAERIDPLAEEKADGRVVKLTGPGSLLHSEPVEHIDMATGEVLTEPRTVVGLDGKTYTRPEPAAPRRRPLPDAFGELVYQMRLKAESLDRLTRDDRFAANKEKTAESELRRLINTRDLLNQVIDQLS